MRLQDRAFSRSLVLMATCAALFLGARQADAQYLTGSGWSVTGYLVTVTGGSPGAAGYYTTSPYAWAYQGQSSTYAYADARYTQSFTTTYPGITGGDIHWSWQVIGTLGFFDNPIDPAWDSQADAGSSSGPPDYNNSGGRVSHYNGLPVVTEVSLYAEVYNYGHSSGSASCFVEGTH